MDCSKHQLSVFSHQPREATLHEMRNRQSSFVNRQLAWVVRCLVVAVVALGALPALAQDIPEASPKQMKQVKQLQDDAQKLGAWDTQYLLIEEAVDNIFQQHGWNSEADVFARDLARDVGRISPWKPRERINAFLDGLQVRYSLTHDQRTSLDGDIQREAMIATIKHLKDTLPVAMEIVRTRAKQEPFTAEQVQRWSRRWKPLMDDSLRTVERVTDQLKKTMTEEQRKTLESDMKALLKRHHDMEKMVEKWQAGNWNPADWGLQNDPIHAGAMAEYLALEAEKNERVEAAKDKKGLDEDKIATDESGWDRYVRQFCNKYECTDAQRTTANAILKNCKKEAIDYRNAHRDLIEKHERLSKTAETEALRNQHATALQTELEPIAKGFERLKARLHGQVLTTKQRRMFASQTPAKTPD